MTQAVIDLPLSAVVYREDLYPRIESDPSLIQRYEMIFSRRNGLAVAEARGGTCQGCRMRLPPQLYNQIQRHDSIHFCPNCQRILYHEGEGERHG